MTEDSRFIKLGNADEHLLLVRDASRTIVSISPEGKLTIGEGYDTDSAAKAFWEAVSRQAVMCNHAYAVRLIYTEACVRFRDARDEFERSEWGILCMALESAYGKEVMETKK